MERRTVSFYLAISLSIFSFIAATNQNHEQNWDWTRDLFQGYDDPVIFEDDDVIVNTPSLGEGVTVEGRRTIVDAGRNGSVFRGIKFADAQRFKIPLPKEYPAFTKIPADRFGPCCPTTGSDSFIADQYMDEHCQYLNIYTPDDPETLKEEGKKLPVMMFIYGGAFLKGCGLYYFPNTFLLIADVIVVTMNYRLGALGFFTLNNDTAPGNYALYDQRAALRWINGHIEDFGGDTSQVTVFGESAGSVSTSYMTIVADSETIHGAISESGTITEVWSLDPKPEFAARWIADWVDCYDNITDYIDMICMNEVSYYDLTEAELALSDYDRKHGGMGFNGCAPTIQDKEKVTDAILTKAPWQHYADGEFNDIPYMMGTNKDEGSLLTSIVEGVMKDLHVFDKPAILRMEMVNTVLNSFGIHDPSHVIANVLTQEYCLDVDLGNYYVAAPCLIDMFGAIFLKAGGWKMANMHSNYSNSKTFHYSFDYDDQKHGAVYNENYDVGVTHAEELKYLFYADVLTDIAVNVSDRMLVMWTNFAKYGDPTPEAEDNWSNLDVPKFLPYVYRDHNFLLMREDFIMQKEFPRRWNARDDEEMIEGWEPTFEPPQFPDQAEPEWGPPGAFQGVYSQRDSAQEGPNPYLAIKTPDDVEEMEDKRDAYMITMIVFVVLTFLTDCAAIYFFIKWRKSD